MNEPTTAAMRTYQHATKHAEKAAKGGICVEAREWLEVAKEALHLMELEGSL